MFGKGRALAFLFSHYISHKILGRNLNLLLLGARERQVVRQNSGDDKIFIYDDENVVKVRTGEEGYAALQDAE